jgi:glycosyltransferase involved in cell wall biosynthesis
LPGPHSFPFRLGVFADLSYLRDAEGLSTDRAFVRFVTGLSERVDELVLFGRLRPEPGRAANAVPANVRFVPLPYYPRVSDLPGLARAVASAPRVFARALDDVDAVWLFGPHPLSLIFAGLARRRGKRVFLGVRQELAQYIGHRLPSRAWAWALPVAHGLERSYRLLAKTCPTVVVGEELGRLYGRSGGDLLVTGFSLITDDQIVAPEAARKDWSGEVRLLSVGRLDAEKNPLLLADVVDLLPAGFSLDVIGVGPLEPELRRRAGERIRLHGYVAHPELAQRYRDAHAFVHVSLTEGLPQVLFEAEAAGIPIVATDVGGVADAVGGGERALLVPPRDAQAVADAVLRLDGDPTLRETLVRCGVDHVAGETMDAQLDRIAAFFDAAMRGPARPR